MEGDGLWGAPGGARRRRRLSGGFTGNLNFKSPAPSAGGPAPRWAFFHAQRFAHDSPTLAPSHRHVSVAAFVSL